MLNKCPLQFGVTCYPSQQFMYTQIYIKTLLSAGIQRRVVWYMLTGVSEESVTFLQDRRLRFSLLRLWSLPSVMWRCSVWCLPRFRTPVPWSWRKYLPANISKHLTQYTASYLKRQKRGTSNFSVMSDVLMAVAKNYCPWDATPCRLVDIYRCFGLFYPEDGGRTVFWSIYQATQNHKPDDGKPSLWQPEISCLSNNKTGSEITFPCIF
jgi:hypothetical protein